MFDILQKKFDLLERRIRQVAATSYRSEVTGARVAVDYADLPTAGFAGQMFWVNDGRKPGEGAGTGTGVPASWDNATGVYISDYDQNPVAV